MKKFTLLSVASIIVVQLFAQPVITSFSPASGPQGTTVSIRGTGFGTTPNSNSVYFGAVKASVLTAEDTLLTVLSPIGATVDFINITTGNRTAYSMNTFVSTFPGGAGPFNPNSFLPKVDYTAGNLPHGVNLADFNLDGKPDLLVTRGSSSSVTILSNLSTAGAITFGANLDLPATGNSHESGAIGDFDGDGKLDFVITNSHFASSVSVFRNVSTGGGIAFAPKVTYASDSIPYGVAVGDLDGDGKPDIAAANGASSVISVLKNTSSPGNISFNPRVDFNCGSMPYGIAVGDLDGDGKADLAITTQYPSRGLYVMKNTTNGGIISFSSPLYCASLSLAFSVSIADVDGDGKPDLTVADGGSIVVVRNNSTPGSLSFETSLSYSSGDYSRCVSLGDLDGDGKPDIVSANQNSNIVAALRNLSTPGHISFALQVDYASAEYPMFVAVGDMDADGRPDIASANGSTDKVSILKNVIGSSLVPTVSSFTPTSGANGTSVTILGTNFTGTTSVKFGGIVASSFVVDSATGITAIVGTGASGAVSVTTPNGTGTKPGFSYVGPIINSFSPTFGNAGTIVTILGLNFTGATSVKFGGTPAASFTVNSSTSISAVVGNGSNGSVSVTTNNGTGSLAGFVFGPPKITSVTPTSGPVGSSVTITGSNFDTSAVGNIVFFGAVKARVISATSSQLVVTVPAGASYKPITVTSWKLTAYSSQPFVVTFPSDTLRSTSFTLVNNFGTGAYPIFVVVSDLNDDGKPDMITSNGIGNNISVFKNSSVGSNISFSSRSDYGAGPSPGEVGIGDLDGDGKPDLVVVSGNSGNASFMRVYRNNSTGGNISFDENKDFNTGNGSFGISISDMNGDGRPDVLVGSGNSGYFSYFQNMSTGPGDVSFAPKRDFTQFDHPDRNAIADLDKDGRPDFITSNFSGSNISVYQNYSAAGSFGFGAINNYGTPTYPTDVAAADFDGDGWLDIAVSHYGNLSMSLFKNQSNVGFPSLGSRQTYSQEARNVSTEDLNGDGKVDLIVGRYGGAGGAISIAENTTSGNGNFSFAPSINFPAGTYETWAAAADLDGDGRPELLSANTTTYAISVYKNIVGDPSITTVNPSVGGAGATVTINGKNFSSVTGVKFGSVPAASFTVSSPTKIDAVVGAGQSGDISVITDNAVTSYPGFNFIPVINPAGPATICKGSSFLLTSTASSNNQWYKDGVIINGATANTYSATAGGTYTVKTTANGITTTTPSGVAVLVTTVPVPTISIDTAHTLISSAMAGNQWYKDGNIIAGATDQKYHPSENGSYTVRVKVDSCVSDPSTSFIFSVTGIIDLGRNQFINLYPNPVKRFMRIDWQITGTSLLNVTVSDLNGRQMISRKNIYGGTSINLSALPDGIYLVRISDRDNKIDRTMKIIKRK